MNNIWFTSVLKQHFSNVFFLFNNETAPLFYENPEQPLTDLL